MSYTVPARNRRRHKAMTDLQLATTLRYEECAGEHAFTGETLVRELQAQNCLFYVCGRCGVPILGGKLA